MIADFTRNLRGLNSYAQPVFLRIFCKAPANNIYY